jgi:NhaP-type Na+/H+ or K+/H+ antiporter
MTQALISVAFVLVAWALLAVPLDRFRITAPITVVLAGIAIGFTTRNTIAEDLNTEVALHAAEIILALLLFIDASDVRGGLFGSDPRSVLRILFIALPLSLGFAVLLGLWLLPGSNWAVLLVIACVVVPIDFAPAAFIVRDRRIPAPVRNVLNVESGYNDGVVSPILIFALALAAQSTHANTPMEALSTAVPSALKAILVGSVVGVALAFTTNVAERHNLMTDQSKRIALVAAPVLSYAGAITIGGNGFIAAFVCGFVCNYVREPEPFRRELELLDDIGFLLTVVMWFVFGSAAVFVLYGSFSWRTILYCLLALTIVRIAPVLVAMVRSHFSYRDRLLIAWLGPRGTTSIVFGLLAFNRLNGDAAELALAAMVFVVLGSVVLHGATATIGINRSDPS